MIELPRLTLPLLLQLLIRDNSCLLPPLLFHKFNSLRITLWCFNYILTDFLWNSFCLLKTQLNSWFLI